MRDRAGRVIYVGKSRRLKNRVSVLSGRRKNPKTERMASLVRDFEVVICSTEIEALTLENAFIKQHSPKYNIKLKDAKSYPYIKITKGDYPRLSDPPARGRRGKILRPLFLHFDGLFGIGGGKQGAEAALLQAQVSEGYAGAALYLLSDGALLRCLHR